MQGSSWIHHANHISTAENKFLESLLQKKIQRTQSKHLNITGYDEPNDVCGDGGDVAVIDGFRIDDEVEETCSMIWNSDDEGG